MVPESYSAARSSASLEPVTTEYGQGVLDGIEDDIRSIDKCEGDHYSRLFGRIAKLCKHHNGGSIAWHDAEAMLYAVVEETRLRTRHDLKSDIRSAIRRVGHEALHPPGEGRAADIAPRLAPEPPETPWADPVGVQALWGSTVPIAFDGDAYAWSMLRGFDHREAEFQRLARFIPRLTSDDLTPEQVEAVKRVLPSATKLWGEWGPPLRLGYRVALPTYDADGVLRSLRLRLVNIKRGKDGITKLRELKSDDKKSLSLRGRAKSAVLANGGALELLRGNRPRGEYVVIIAEGEIDFLVISLEPDEVTRCVFGLPGEGAWSFDIAKKIPGDARVLIATHSDNAGEGYAKAVRATLPGQGRLERWRPWSVGMEALKQDLTPYADSRKLKHDVADVHGLRGGANNGF